MLAKIRERLIAGNRRFREAVNRGRLSDTAANGQHPYVVVVCCSDSRVIPERIFNADIGELFVIRVAGNVLDNQQIGSVEYALQHLHCDQVIVLGHTGCGAVAAALAGGAEGFTRFITDDIRAAIGQERDPYRACCLNVGHSVEKLKRALAGQAAAIQGAVYDIATGAVEFL